MRPFVETGLTERPTSPGVALVLDADRTLAPVDTGREVGRHFHLNDTIRAVFERLGYSREAFARVAAIWSEVPAERWVAVCAEVAREVAIHSAWMQVLKTLPTHVPVFAVTAGIPNIWKRALGAHGLARVRVIGGCHSAFDDYFVTPTCKEAVVRQLQSARCRVVAAGDSEIDLPMLRRADIPLFVADRRGSPRLLRRLDEVPGVQHFATDERRFDPHPVVTPSGLLLRIQQELRNRSALRP